MRRVVRFLLGAGVGGGALAGYLWVVGLDSVRQQVLAVAPWAVGVVATLVIAEGLADAIGVWASVEPLGDGLTPGQSVQFALAGDFFDVLSPAGPVTSEPIMARFIGVTTGTSYSEALGVRSVAKYVKSGAQLLVSAGVGLVVVAGGTGLGPVATVLGLGIAGLAAFGVVAVRARGVLTRGLAAVLAPVVALLSSLSRADPYDRTAVEAALERFWERVLGFGHRPGLLGLVALGGVTEQLLTAAALWVALSGTGVATGLLPIVVLVPLPQVSSVVPVPASLGAYDLLLGGALAVVAGVPAPEAAAAVLVVRALTVPFGIAVGGVSAALLRGWRP